MTYCLDPNGREIAQECDFVQATAEGGMPFHARTELHRMQGLQLTPRLEKAPPVREPPNS